MIYSGFRTFSYVIFVLGSQGVVSAVYKPGMNINKLFKEQENLLVNTKLAFIE